MTTAQRGRGSLIAGAAHVDQQRGPAYAAPSDFCAIFREDMSALYWLSLLLTGDHEKAEQCFVAALEDCLTGKLVFKEWARSWSRRSIIENAIRVVAPAASEDAGAPASMTKALADHLDRLLRTLTHLSPFDRFVFVMSVLERYSDRECAALLKCAWREVPRARNRALQLVARSGRDILPMSYADGSNRNEHFSVAGVA